jgi:DNA-binding transcriptional MerR regulator
MKISELARRGGIPIHTLKYYIREGLLPAGRTTAVNQADYGDFHLRRLRFIRALTGAGGLSIPATREILAAIDSPPTDPGDLLQVVGRSLGSTRRPWPADESRRFAVDQVDALLHRRAWRRPSTVDALDDLIDVVAGFYAVGVDPQPTLNVYADAVTVLARHDLADLRPAGEQPAERRGALERMTARAVLGEALLGTLRRLAILVDTGEHSHVTRPTDTFVPAQPVHRHGTGGDR